MKKRKPSLPNHKYVRGVLVFVLFAFLAVAIGALTYGRRTISRDITRVTNVSINELSESGQSDVNTKDYDLVSSIAQLEDNIGNKVYLVGTLLAGRSDLSLRDGRTSIDYEAGAGRLLSDISTAYLLLVDVQAKNKVQLIELIDSRAYMAATTEYGFHSRFLGSEIINCLPDYQIYRSASVSASKSEIESVIFRSQLSHSAKVMSDFTYELVDPKLQQSVVQDNAASYCRDDEPQPQAPTEPEPEEDDTIDEEDLPIEWFAGSDNLIPVDALDID